MLITPHAQVPKFLMEKWSEVQEEGVILGRVRVYDECVPLLASIDTIADNLCTVRRKDSYGDPKIAVILDESPTASGSSTPSSSSTKPDVKGKGAEVLRSKRVPTEYKLTLQNTASKNMFVFGEKEEEDEDSGEVGARKRRRSFHPALCVDDHSLTRRTDRHHKDARNRQPRMRPHTLSLLD